MTGPVSLVDTKGVNPQAATAAATDDWEWTDSMAESGSDGTRYKEYRVSPKFDPSNLTTFYLPAAYNWEATKKARAILDPWYDEVCKKEMQLRDKEGIGYLALSSRGVVRALLEKAVHPDNTDACELRKLLDVANPIGKQRRFLMQQLQAAGLGKKDNNAPDLVGALPVVPTAMAVLTQYLNCVKGTANGMPFFYLSDGGTIFHQIVRRLFEFYTLFS